MTERNTLKMILPLLLIFGFAVPFLSAQSADEIIRRVDEKQQIETSRAKLTMVVYPDMYNEDDARRFSILALGRGEEDSYMVFLSPRTIRGLAMLSRGGDQWVFFPSTGRVRKIAARSKDSSVRGVGGDFTYEDFSAGNWEEKYDFTILDESSSRWVLEGIPTSESTYSKILVYIAKGSYLVEKIEYFKEGPEPTRELIMGEVRMIGGREMATRIEMINLEKESKTVIITHNAEYDISIDEKYFNPTRFYR